MKIEWSIGTTSWGKIQVSGRLGDSYSDHSIYVSTSQWLTDWRVKKAKRKVLRSLRRKEQKLAVKKRVLGEADTQVSKDWKRMFKRKGQQ